MSVHKRRSKRPSEREPIYQSLNPERARTIVISFRCPRDDVRIFLGIIQRPRALDVTTTSVHANQSGVHISIELAPGFDNARVDTTPCCSVRHFSIHLERKREGEVFV